MSTTHSPQGKPRKPHSNYFEKYYPGVYDWFSNHEKALGALTFLYHVNPLLSAAAYICLLTTCFLSGDLTLLAKEILIPAALFLTVSLLRKCFDYPRPYTVYQIRPLVNKKRKGESFPSRHSASAVIIAAAGLYWSVPFGIALFVLSALISASRLLAGVHFPKDVAAGWGIALAFSVLFLL